METSAILAVSCVIRRDEPRRRVSATVGAEATSARHARSNCRYAGQAVHLGPGHDADLPTVLALGGKLTGGSMPRDVIVFAVEASDLTTVSTELTPAVANAVAEAADRIESLCSQDSSTAG